jgi:hypothetical protein
MAGRATQEIGQGAVLAVPLTGGRWALAQVLVPGVVFYLGAATVPFDRLPDAADIEGLPLSIFSWTNDAEVYRGNWKVLGIYALQSSAEPRIEYKVGTPEGMMVEAFGGEILRPFSPEADAHLEYRKSRSPLLVQDMVRGACGG